MERVGRGDGGEIMSENMTGMVDVGERPIVARRAIASGILGLKTASANAIREKKVSKGDVIEASTIAAIQAVKETPRIIPHCHPIPLESCNVEWSWQGDSLRCTVTVGAHYRTGIEMEALTGVSAGLLCALDMVQSFEKEENGQCPTASLDDIKVVQNLKSQ